MWEGGPEAGGGPTTETPEDRGDFEVGKRKKEDETRSFFGRFVPVALFSRLTFLDELGKAKAKAVTAWKIFYKRREGGTSRRRV